MKRFLLALILMVGFIPLATHAQILDEKQEEQLTNTIRRDYMKTQAEGVKVFKLSKKKHILSVCVIVNSNQNISQQNRVGQMKAARLASEFLNGTMNKSVSVYETNSETSSDFSKKQEDNTNSMNSGIGSEQNRNVNETEKESSSETFSDKIVQSAIHAAAGKGMEKLSTFRGPDDEKVFVYYLPLEQ